MRWATLNRCLKATCQLNVLQQATFDHLFLHTHLPHSKASITMKSVFTALRPMSSYTNATTEVLPTPEPGPKFKLAVCQLTVTDDKQKNIQSARTAIEQAAASGAELIVLPEMWNCPYSNSSFPTYAEDISSGYAPSYSFMSDLARQTNVVLVGGSIPEKAGDNLYNTCFIFGKTGKLLGRHRKTHLFDIDIPGKITFKESDTLTPGESITVVDTELGRIAVGICYDIRFPELAGLYAARGAQMIVYPGAFNMTTGPLHWELLQRARAVDNQLYVASCSPARDEGGSYVAWGHSTVIDPFGDLLSKLDEKEGITYADIDFSVLNVRRQNMPLEQQRRSDLYALLDLTRE